MFIRWIERPSKDGYDFTALSVILAESKRVNGVPRQRHIAYLGGITDDRIEDLGSRCDFWDQVTATFDKLDNQVMPKDRRRFETAIADRVPRPNAKERKAVTRERDALAQERAEQLPELMEMARKFRVSNLLPRFPDSFCAFCGKISTDMVKGDTGAMICDACITLLAQAHHDRGAR